LLLSRDDQASVLERISTNFPVAPAKRDNDDRENMKISVHNSNDDDAARLFSCNSPAGSGMVLPYQETLSAIDSNSSNSDRVNASVR